MRIICGLILASAVAATASAATTLYEATPEELSAPARSEAVVTNFPTTWPQKPDRLWVELWCADSGEDPVKIIVRGKGRNGKKGGKGRNGKKDGAFSRLVDLPEKGRCAVSLATRWIKGGVDFNAVTNVTVRTVDGEPRRFGVARLLLLDVGEAPPAFDEAPRPHVRDAAAHHECYLKFRESCRSGGFVVGQATSMENIRPRAAFTWRDAEEVCVRLARGERESVQLLVAPAEHDLKDVRVAVEMDGGFAATNVAACVVGYVETRDPAPYKVRIGSKIVETPRGWWPDPILDFQKSCDIAGEDVQSFWVRVTCPTNQAAGTYVGRLVVSASNAEPVAVRLKVRVNDFSVGNVSPLPLAVSCIYPKANVNSIGGDSALAKWLNTNPDSYLKAWKTREEKYCDFLADYYLTPDSPYVNPTHEPRWDMLVRLKKQGRLGLFNLCYWWYMGLGEKGEAFWRERDLPVLRERYEKAKALGIEKHAYLYGCDEQRPNVFTNMAVTIAALRREFPDVPLLTTANDVHLGTGSSPLKDVNHCPLTCWMGRPVRKAQAEGRQVWWYICCDPPAPEVNAMMEGPPVELRLLMGAMTQRVKPDGFLYWETMAWNSKNPITKGPFTDWNPNSFGNFRGDGQWICCGGPDLLPLATLRLENFRDGLEDLWYCRILEEKIREVQSSELQVGEKKTGGTGLADSERRRSWLDRALKALAVPKEVVKSPRSFSTKPDVIYRWRDGIAELIEEICHE